MTNPTIPRDIAQAMLAKLDLGLAKPSEVATWAWHTYHVELSGRTRAQVARSINRHLRDAPATC